MSFRRLFVLLVIVNFENNQLAFRVEYTKSAELFVDSERPNAAAFWISLLEFYLEATAREEISFCFFVLGQ